MAASGRGIDHCEAADASTERPLRTPEELVQGSAAKRVRPVEVRAILAESPIVVVGRQDQKCGRHSTWKPPPSSSCIPRAPLGNPDLPVEVPQVVDLGLYLDHDEDPFAWLECEEIGKPAPSIATDIDLGRHLEAHASDPTSDICHAAGMRAVPLNHRCGRQSDETHLHPRVEAIENLKGHAKRQVRDPGPLESRDVALADVDHPGKALL